MENGQYQKYPFTVYTYDSVDSTNAVARRAVEMVGEGMDKSVHVAGEQTKGRGRNGRSWLNTTDAVMMSIVVMTKLRMDRLPILNLVAAVAVKNAVTRLTDGVVGLTIKWPNDLLTEDRLEKVCGILSEAVTFRGKKYAIIGIGLDLNAKEMPEGLLQPASSIRINYGKYIGVTEAVNTIIEEFEKQFKLMNADTDAFLKGYAKECVSIGRHVKVDSGTSVRYGMGDKLAPNGQLVVRFEDGETDVVYAADVSVRNLNTVDERLALKLMPKRKADSNKGSHGKALLIVGSEGMPGAALMSTKACIRAGAGLTKALIPEAIKPSFALIPEAMLETDDQRTDELIKWADSILIGCGMGVSKRTECLLKKVLLSKKPCVIDADALNTMAKSEELKGLLHDKAVITPHPAEMGRLIYKSADEVVKSFTPSALAFAEKYGCSVLLKSSTSVIVSADGTVRYNDTGTSGLAKGGSGDILAGIVTALMAQKAKPYDAASLGAYILGLSAEKALDFLHNRFVCAGDIIDIIAGEMNGNV